MPRVPGNSESGDTDSSLEQYWLKIADPRAEPPTFPDGADIRVLLPTSAEFHDLRAKLTANGVDWRAVRYLVDDEIITRRSSQLSECYLARSARRQPFSTTGPEATSARTWPGLPSGRSHRRRTYVLLSGPWDARRWTG